MKEKITITRWILSMKKEGTVELREREVSAYAPLNRILDKVGFFTLEFFSIGEERYFCTYEPAEKDINKSCIHVGKMDQGTLVDMTQEDCKNLEAIKIKFFFRKQTILH